MISQSSPRDAGRPGAMPAGRAVVAAVAIVAAIAATCALGAWQLRRAAGKEALQQRFEAAAHAPPVEPDAAALREPRLLVDRHVRFAGRWRPDGVVYLDNRPLAGVSGFEVLMPLAIDGPRPVDVIVDRGWVPRDPHDRQRIASYRTPDGPVAVDGVALADAPRLLELGKPAERRLGGIWQNFDFDAYARASGSLPLRLVVRQDAGGARRRADPRGRRSRRCAAGADRSPSRLRVPVVRACRGARRLSRLSHRPRDPAWPPCPSLNARRRGRVKLWLVLAICAAPVIASYVVYYFVRPDARSNYGTLIQPQRPTPAAAPDDARRPAVRRRIAARQVGAC